MPTLILTPRFTDDAQLLWRAAGRLGWRVERLRSLRVPDHLRDVDEPVLYLEALIAPTVAEAFGLSLLGPANDWLPTLPDEYRLRSIRLTTLGEARTNPNPRFVKPPNDKSFAAGVYLGRDLPTDFPADTPVLSAEIVQWECEYRCFVLDRRVRTASVYLRDGILQKSDGYAAPVAELAEAMAFAERLLADPRVSVPRAVVLDVGRIWNRGWAAVELNAAWGSGIYGCDAEAVLDVLRRAMGRV